MPSTSFSVQPIVVTQAEGASITRYGRRVDATVKSRYDATPINNIYKYNPFTSHNHITIFFFSGAVWLCRCGARGVNMPVWGVRCVYVGVLYTCTPVRVRKPCCSVTLYFVVSTTSTNAVLLDLVAIVTRQDFVRMLLSGKNLSHSLLVIHVLYCCHTFPTPALQVAVPFLQYTLRSLFVACAVLIIVVMLLS